MNMQTEIFTECLEKTYAEDTQYHSKDTGIRW